MTERNRKTAISWVEPDGILIRGYRVEELIGGTSWGEAVYLLLRGELPDPHTLRLFEAVLVSVMEHGVSPPSTMVAVTVASTGASLGSAIAAGMLAINRYHGGAIEECMTVLEDCIQLHQSRGMDAVEAAHQVVAELRERGQRVPGFGHRFHHQDPRTMRLFELAREVGLAGTYVQQAEALGEAISTRVGQRLPINADGAIAALLCEMGFPRPMANGLFAIARVAGLVAHACEEQQRNKPMLTVDAQDYEYDGPAERPLKKG